MLDFATIEKRKQARETAEEVFDLAYCSDMGDTVWREAFFEKLEQLTGRASRESSEKTVYPPLARVASETMPFGQYQGQRFDDIPFEYLDWLCSQQENFLSILRAYLKHPDLNRWEESDDR